MLSQGKSRAQEAAAAAISSPLLDFPIEKAKGVVFNIVGGNDLTLQEINAAAEVIYEAVDPNANIIFGALVDESMNGEIAITVIATGFPIQGQSPRSTMIDEDMEETKPRTVADAKRISSIEKEEDIPTPKGKDNDIPDFISKLRRRK